MDNTHYFIAAILLALGFLTSPIYSIGDGIHKTLKAAGKDPDDDGTFIFGSIIFLLIIVLGIGICLYLFLTAKSFLEGWPMVVYVIGGAIGWLISLKIAGVQIIIQPLIITKTESDKDKVT